MAISSAICNTFKTEVLKAVHNFTASSGNSFKLALYTSSASMGASTTAYKQQMKLQIHQVQLIQLVEKHLQV